MASLAMGLVVLLFVFFAPSRAERIHHNEENSIATLPVRECNEDTCVTFREVDDACSCVPFIKEDDGEYLALRAQEILYGMAQKMRYLTDYETTKTSLQSLWLLTKFKNVKILSASLSDFRFIQGAARALPDFRQFAMSPVDHLDVRKVPAGAFPIMVEIWDKEVFSKNQFVGEAGMNLELGQQHQALKLRPNPSRGTETAKLARTKELGKVEVWTEVKYSTDMNEAVPCNFDPQKACTEVTLTVKCLGAKDLINVDSGLMGDVTDPYCKVRVKKRPEMGSTKNSTPTIDNDLNPKWTKDNVFTFKWQAVLADSPSGKDPVLRTLDHMSLLGQFRANLRLLVEGTVLKGKKCSDATLERTQEQAAVLWRDGHRNSAGATAPQGLRTPQVKICKVLADQDNRRVGAETIAEVKSSTKLSEDDEQAVDAMVEEVRAVGSPKSLIESTRRSRHAGDEDTYYEDACEEDTDHEDCGGEAVALVLGILLVLLMLFLQLGLR